MGPRISLAFNLRVRWLDGPLPRAAIAGRVQELRRLVDEEGGDVEAADPELGLRPLHLAAEAGHMCAVEALIGLGADAAATSVEGWSPLSLAAERGHLAMVQRLLMP